LRGWVDSQRQRLRCRGRSWPPCQRTTQRRGTLFRPVTVSAFSEKKHKQIAENKTSSETKSFNNLLVRKPVSWVNFVATVI
jgi:hypothetical protein